jgi:hypothetical protein
LKTTVSSVNSSTEELGLGMCLLKHIELESLLNKSKSNKRWKSGKKQEGMYFP